MTRAVATITPSTWRPGVSGVHQQGSERENSDRRGLAGRRLDERAIDNLQGDDVVDFLITVKMKLADSDTGPGQLVSEYVPEGEDPGKFPLQRYRLEIHRISGSALVLAGSSTGKVNTMRGSPASALRRCNSA